MAPTTKTSPLRQEVEQACRDITASSTSKETRAALDGVKILGVREVEVPATGRRALIITVPYIQFTRQIKANQGRCVAELEKKTKRHVCIIAKRDVLQPKSRAMGSNTRPFSRSLTAMQNALIQDVSSPAEVCGKRLRLNTDGSQCLRILLDPKDRTKDNIEEKLATYGAVYQSLTHKNAVFEFAEYVL